METIATCTAKYLARSYTYVRMYVAMLYVATHMHMHSVILPGGSTEGMVDGDVLDAAM